MTQVQDQEFNEYVEYINGIMFDGAIIIEEKINRPNFIDRCSKEYFCDRHWGNALSVACEFRNEELMEVLLLAGADPNFEIAGYRPLDSAVVGHSVGWIYNFSSLESCIRLLLKYGAKRELQDTCVENHESQWAVLATEEAGEYLNKFISDMETLQKEKGKYPICLILDSK